MTAKLLELRVDVAHIQNVINGESVYSDLMANLEFVDVADGMLETA
jgi:hypothetical protein